MISPQDFKYFMSIAQNGSLRKAALSVHISQPALTHALKRLEAELGTLLFERTRKGLKLTSAGERLLARGESLVREWEGLAKTLKSDESELIGRISFGCHPSVSLFTLPGFFPRFQKSHPSIDFVFFHDLSRHVTQAVIDGKVDIGVVVNPLSHPELIIRDLGTDEVTLWKKKDCERTDTLIFDPNLGQTQWLLKKLESKKIQFRHRIESSSLEVIAELVSLGCGVGVLPARVLRGNVRRFSDSAPVYHDRHCLIYKPQFRKSARGQAFIESILAAQSGR